MLAFFPCMVSCGSVWLLLPLWLLYQLRCVQIPPAPPPPLPQKIKIKTTAKTALVMESIKVDSKNFHKACFRCTTCNNVLRLGNFAALQGCVHKSVH